MPRQLVWFRSDLRLEDNPALFRACQQGEVVAVFVHSPEQWQEHGWGDLKTAFVLSNLHALAQQLRQLNIPLKILTILHLLSYLLLLHLTKRFLSSMASFVLQRSYSFLFL